VGRAGRQDHPYAARRPMIVLDASAAVELLGDTQAGKRIAARLSSERVLHAPHLLDLEVASAFRRQVALGAVDAERVARTFALHQNLRIMPHPHYPYLDRIWDLRDNFTAYDA